MKVGNNVQVLIVEDDAVQAQVLIDKFTENNNTLNIRHFLSGENLVAFLNGKDKCSKKCYLVLDYFLQTEKNMDGLNGIDVIKTLQSKYPFIKTIIYSAYETDDNLNFETLLEDHNNVIGVVKKSDYAYSTLENIIRFDYINHVFKLKRKRFVLARNIFIVVFFISIFLLLVFNL